MSTPWCVKFDQYIVIVINNDAVESLGNHHFDMTIVLSWNGLRFDKFFKHIALFKISYELDKNFAEFFGIFNVGSLRAQKFLSILTESYQLYLVWFSLRRNVFEEHFIISLLRNGKRDARMLTCLLDHNVS
ncbi:hypothetical protein RF11_01095 [Thelohanellus kitauei]|uniref:Uncharacterized protein n=1 Tax=Thelohanellus kitauei TaxID=669202 RepID=A0A0C2MX46_THEKT|nr:hypothetical protein RF11_01095 [Thelohanellus kitauei]